MKKKAEPEKLLCATGTIHGTLRHGRSGTYRTRRQYPGEDPRTRQRRQSVRDRKHRVRSAALWICLHWKNSPDTTEIAISASIKDLWFDSINSRQLEINISVSIEIWAIRHCVFTHHRKPLHLGIRVIRPHTVDSTLRDRPGRYAVGYRETIPHRHRVHRSSQRPGSQAAAERRHKTARSPLTPRLTAICRDLARFAKKLP